MGGKWTEWARGEDGQWRQYFVTPWYDGRTGQLVKTPDTASIP